MITRSQLQVILNKSFAIKWKPPLIKLQSILHEILFNIQSMQHRVTWITTWANRKWNPCLLPLFCIFGQLKKEAIKTSNSNIGESLKQPEMTIISIAQLGSLWGYSSAHVTLNLSNYLHGKYPQRVTHPRSCSSNCTKQKTYQMTCWAWIGSSLHNLIINKITPWYLKSSPQSWTSVISFIIEIYLS